MARLIAITALVGAGWWAYQQGHLEPLLERLGVGQADSLWPTTSSVVQDQGGPSPVIAANGLGVNRSDLTKEQQIIWDNTDVLSPWALANPNWTAAMLWQESKGNHKAVGPRTKWGHAYGVMQVLPGTAEQMYNAGWDRFQPTEKTLLTLRGGLYFGTAYLEYLSRRNPDREWMTKAYHGGPDGEARGYWGSRTHGYLDAVKGRYETITKGELT